MILHAVSADECNDATAASDDDDDDDDDDDSGFNSGFGFDFGFVLLAMVCVVEDAFVVGGLERWRDVDDGRSILSLTG
jgi:hypothetical protein